METLDLFKLNGELAVITGGAGLLGKEHATALLDAGAKVVLLDIDKKRLKDEVKKFENKYGGRIWGLAIDVRDEKMIRMAINKIEKGMGRISILINNVAYNPPLTKRSDERLENFTLERWNEYIAIGLTSAFLMSKIIGKLMADRKKGVIVNISSDLGLIAPDQRIYKVAGLPREKQPAKAVGYSIVKHGIMGLTKYLATYWAEDGVRVNSLSPSGVGNENIDKVFLEKLSSLIPMGRMAKKEEYRAAIIFLCSNASSYMTGSNLIVDGGRTCW